MSKKREATPYVQKAIRAIVDYNYGDEQDDYENNCGDGPEDNARKGHIFESLKTVQRWLDR